METNFKIGERVKMDLGDGYGYRRDRTITGVIVRVPEFPAHDFTYVIKWDDNGELTFEELGAFEGVA